MSSSPSSPQLLLLTLVTALASCGRCDSPTSSCAPECPSGFVCQVETNLCLTDSLPLYEGEEVPGRGARILSTSQGFLAVTIDPERRAVLLGGRQGDGRWRWRTLATEVRAGSRHLAIATSANYDVIAWIGQDGFYHLAVHRAADPVDSWSVELVRVVIRDEMVPSYRATDDFALALDTLENPVLAFHDRSERALVYLESLKTDQAWLSSVVDDGYGASTARACPSSLRDSRKRGVGLEPDLLVTADAITIAYHDADCGDLRLARRGASGRWLVSVLDRGDSTPLEDHITGRYPSLALGPEQQVTLAYMDLSRGRLLYGELGEEGFSREVVDPGLGLAATSQRPKKIVGAFARHSFASDGLPRITYFDGSTLDAVLATASPAEAQGGAGAPRFTWQRKVLASEGATGLFLDHALDVEANLMTCVMERLRVDARGTHSAVEIVEQEP